MARDILEGNQFDDILVTKYLGNKKYETVCTLCGNIKIMYSNNIKNHVGTHCHLKSIPEDLTGRQFGDWEVLSYSGKGKYLCRCICGTEKEVLKVNLLNGSSTSCGHRRNSYGDLTGKQFGEWTVLNKEGYLWRCRCTCGKERLIGSGELNSGKTKSCGHDYNEFKDLTGKTFGHWKVIEYLGNGMYKCQCDCADLTIKAIRGQDLLRGATTSCGCSKVNKIKQTLYERYGETAPNKIENPRTTEQITAVESKYNLINFINSHFKDKPTSIELADSLGIQLHRTLTIVHKYELESYLSRDNSTSNSEREIAEFIESICNETIIKGDRQVLSGKELDIYIPNLKIAFEFNGNYWHSSALKDRNYHLNKSIECARQGIQLIHIFEYEWADSNKKEKIKSLIKRVINKCNNVVYARKTEVYIPCKEEVNIFLDKNHLQGTAKYDVAIGLKYKDKLIALATFGKPRFNANFQYELIRLCYETEYIVVGGFDKILNNFIKEYNPKSILTYCDASKFTGKSYVRAGFKPLGEVLTPHNYVWFNTKTLEIYTRYQTQKHKLIESGIGDNHQTEDDIMYAHNCLKIYDCGNFKLEWHNPNTGG